MHDVSPPLAKRLLEEKLIACAPAIDVLPGRVDDDDDEPIHARHSSSGSGPSSRIAERPPKAVASSLPPSAPKFAPLSSDSISDSSPSSVSEESSQSVNEEAPHENVQEDDMMETEPFSVVAPAQDSIKPISSQEEGQIDNNEDSREKNTLEGRVTKQPLKKEPAEVIVIDVMEESPITDPKLSPGIFVDLLSESEGEFDMDGRGDIDVMREGSPTRRTEDGAGNVSERKSLSDLNEPMAPSVVVTDLDDHVLASSRGPLEYVPPIMQLQESAAPSFASFDDCDSSLSSVDERQDVGSRAESDGSSSSLLDESELSFDFDFEDV